jgi:hypothetical protein
MSIAFRAWWIITSSTGKTCPSTARRLTSTAGFAHADGGVPWAPIRDVVTAGRVIFDEVTDPSGLSLCSSTSRNGRNEDTSRECSLRLIATAHSSAWCHSRESLSSSGSGMVEAAVDLDGVLETDMRDGDAEGIETSL